MKMKQLRQEMKSQPKPEPKPEPPPENPYEDAILSAELGADVPTLDMHEFKNVGEAMYVLENFVFQKHPTGEALRIIHGKGEQILKTAVQKWLKTQSKYVAEFRDSTKRGEEGGVTYVVLY